MSGPRKAAHLDFLRETLASPQPDEEFTFHFLGQLYQVFYMHEGSAFSLAQTNLLRRVVQRISEKAGTPGTFEYYADDVRLQAEKVLTRMAAHDD